MLHFILQIYIRLMNKAIFNKYLLSEPLSKITNIQKQPVKTKEEYFMKNKGITLIALIITIILLIILAGITISTIVQTGLISKAKLAKEKASFANAEEKIKIAVNSSYNLIGKLDKNILQENLNSIEGLKTIDDIEWDVVINVDGYTFKIDEKGNVKYIKFEDYEKDADKIVDFNLKNSPQNINAVKINQLQDKINNNNAILYNMNLNENRKGLEFDGSNSYGEIKLNQKLTFPITIETTISCSEKVNGLIFLDPESKVGVGLWNDHFCFTVTNRTNTIPIPSDFFNGELKHIVVTYTSSTEFEFYLNGEKVAKNTSKDAWGLSGETIVYLGRRKSGTYFKGTMYNFRIYQKALKDDEVLASYRSDISHIQENSNEINRDGVILEYNTENEIFEEFPYIMEDNNKNQLIFTKATYNEEENGVIFDGNNSYAQLNLKQKLTFPITIEAMIKCTENTNQLLFIDPESKTAIGIVNTGHFCLSAVTRTSTVPIPSDFFNGELKHIVVTYKSLTDFDFYLNGEKIEKNTSDDGWGLSGETVAYLGKRNIGTYFKGTIYKFSIYNEELSENEIIKKYNNIN